MPDAWKYGGGTWLNGAYDPDLDLVYWGTGNAEPHRNPIDVLYAILVGAQLLLFFVTVP
jgi:hypothetical protein